jgi:amino acid permease
MKSGSMSASVFSLIATTMGAGTITMPYIVSLTGIGLGSILIILGAFLSYYSGMLIVRILKAPMIDSLLD